MSLSLVLADKEALKWCQDMVTQHHYLHRPVDTRCSPLAYRVMFFEEPVGCLIFGRPESTKVTGWYGSLLDVARGTCRLSRWQIINLARVWLHPSIQYEGKDFLPNAATWVIAQALRRVAYDYLVLHPPVWLQEPWELKECLSYCNTHLHQGTLYKASNFRLMRSNEQGIETYARSLRCLSHAEKAHIRQRSLQDKRCRRLRAERAQLPLFEEAV